MRGAQRPSTSPSKRSAPSERPAEHSDGDRSTRNAASGTKTTRFEVILHQNDLLHDDIEHQNHVDAFVGTYHTYHVSNDSQTVVDDWNHTMVSVFGNHIAPEKASIGAGAADVPRHEPARLGDRPRHEKPRERVGTGLGSAGPTARTGRAPPGAKENVHDHRLHCGATWSPHNCDGKLRNTEQSDRHEFTWNMPRHEWPSYPLELPVHAKFHFRPLSIPRLRLIL